MIKSLKIKTRLLLGFGAVIIFTVIISVLAIYQLIKLNNLTKNLYEYPVAIKTAVLEANADIIAMHRAMKDIAIAKDYEQIDKAENEVYNYEQDAYKQFEIIQKLFSGDKGIVAESMKYFKEWKTIRDETIWLTRAGENDKAIENTKTKDTEQIKQINSSMNKLIEYSKQNARNIYDDSQNSAINSIKTVVIALILTIIIGVGAAFGITQNISKPVVRLGKLVDQASSGDLTAEYNGVTKRKDEVGGLILSYNNMLKNISSLISQFSENVSTVAAAAQQLTASSQNAASISEEISDSIGKVSFGADKQRKTLETISQSFSKIAFGIERTASNFKLVSDSVKDANKLSENGKNDLNSVISQITLVSDSSKESVSHVHILTEKSKMIENIITMITEIASQTNLLSLNAAIEAARAGEHGKSFAVVADEIRKLAEQTAVSIKSVSDIVKEIRTEIQNVISSIQSQEAQIEEGLERVGMASQSFEKIVKGIDNIAELAYSSTEIAAEISDDTKEIAHFINAIESVSEETSALAENVKYSTGEQASTMEEISESAAMLAELSSGLAESITKFSFVK